MSEITTMKNNKSDLRILLMQFRNTEKVCREEHLSFARTSGVAPQQIVRLDALNNHSFPTNLSGDYDALFVGGSSASALEQDRYPGLECANAMFQHCIDNEFPVFASCFGFQLVTIVLGGKITSVDNNYEMGTIPISLTEKAKTDPIFHDVDSHFQAVSVHQDKSIEAPPGCDKLAFTESCCHAFRIRNKPFWCFQFHPEVDRQTLVDRLTIYKKKYTRNQEELKRVINDARETPESNKLIRKFVDRVLLHNSH